MHPPRTLSVMLTGFVFAAIFLMIGIFPGSAQTYDWQSYSDRDPLLVYTAGNWQTVSVASAVGGDLTYTTDPQAHLTATFLGTGIELLFSKGESGGDFDLLLDGVPARTENSFNPTYTYGHTTTFDHLPAGIHTLTLINGNGAVWIEGLRVQGMLVAPGATMQANPSLSGAESLSSSTALQIAEIASMPRQGSCGYCDFTVSGSSPFDTQAIFMYARVERYQDDARTDTTPAGTEAERIVWWTGPLLLLQPGENVKDILVCYSQSPALCQQAATQYATLFADYPPYQLLHMTHAVYPAGTNMTMGFRQWGWPILELKL